MKFDIKKAKPEHGITKSIYIKQSLANRIEQLAKENDTSFSNIVVAMIEACLKDE